jgi:stearoyl-CoA desaturase (delta-9 desaturase)
MSPTDTLEAPKKVKPSRRTPEPPEAHHMSRLQRNFNITAVVLPFIGFAAAIPLLWNHVLGWSDVGIFIGIYFATAFGITIGYHRLFTHRSFEAHRPTKYLFAILGSMAVQGPVIGWVADHRKHHAFTDEEGDPHSPHLAHGGGLLGNLKGLYHAHMGWLFDEHGMADAKRFAPDLLEDKGMRFINRHFIWWVGLSLAIPFGLGFAITGGLTGALTALLWAGFVRIFMVHHVTWSINSICHFFGRRRFDLEDQSTNVAWLAIPSLGEAWHHNHHAYPRSAAHGLRWYEIDLSAMVIKAMDKVGLAWNVVLITPERQRERLAEEAKAAEAAKAA